jgi:hypothetical protein
MNRLEIGHQYHFKYLGRRNVNATILWIKDRIFGAKLNSDYIGKNTNWYKGETKIFDLEHCKKITRL